MGRLIVIVLVLCAGWFVYNEYGYRYYLSNVRNNIDQNMVMGPANAEMKIVAYVDYDSSASRRLYPVLLNLLSSTSNVSVAIRPIATNNQLSNLMTRVALLAKKKNQFIDVNNAFLTSNINVDENYIKAALRMIGWNFNAIQNELNDPSISSELEQLQREAKMLNIQSLPVFYIDHVRMQGSAYTVSEIRTIMADLKSGRR